MSKNMIIVALDYPNAESALQFTDKLDVNACALKVGFELFVAAGPAFVTKLVERGFKVFLDLKFHDIPNTVASACSAAARLGVWMVNVHAAGGGPMLTAAREALDKFDESQRPLLIAVTVLTSMDQQTLATIGVQGEVKQVVSQWACMAQEHGFDGVVSSAQEASMIRQQCKEDFVIVTPGIRLPDDAKDDQHRIVSPDDAINLGVTHIVVGRPITQAQNPSEALEKFQDAFTRI